MTMTHKNMLLIWLLLLGATLMVYSEFGSPKRPAMAVVQEPIRSLGRAVNYVFGGEKASGDDQ